MRTIKILIQSKERYKAYKIIVIKKVMVVSTTPIKISSQQAKPNLRKKEVNFKKLQEKKYSFSKSKVLSILNQLLDQS
jgi:hypothetical protein